MTFLSITGGDIRRSTLARFAAVVASTGIALAIGMPTTQAVLASAPAGVCAVPGQTWENVFTRVTPAKGSSVHPGDQVGADYHDEGQLNTAPGYKLEFTLTGPGGKRDITPVITDLPAQTGGTNKEFSIVKRIRGTLPANLVPGTYNARMLGFDTDQTHAGADCGTANWSFKVLAAPVGNLTGDILLCGRNTPVKGGTISASGPLPKAAAPTPVSYSQVPTGKYVMAAMAPPRYHFVMCNGTGTTIVSPTSANRTVSVPANRSASARFYVAANFVFVVPPTGVQAAAVSLPNTGHAELARDAVVGLVLVLLGATLLFAVARSTKRA